MPTKPQHRLSRELENCAAPRKKSQTGQVDDLTGASLHPELRPGQSIELLKQLHILTRDGKLNQDSRRKLKQVYHLVQFIEPLLGQARASKAQAGDPVTLADHGAGKSYLGFMLYDLCMQAPGANGHIYGIETRQDLVLKSRELAARLQFTRMSFLDISAHAAIAEASLPSNIDIVTALHACDTATDDAIAFALQKNAQHLVLVPCCQAEVASVLRRNKALALAKTPLSELWRHPLHTREFGSQITNVLRCLQLEAHGYRVTVTELVGWEHSLKNELIIASKLPEPKGAGAAHAAGARLQAILNELGIAELKMRFQ